MYGLKLCLGDVVRVAVATMVVATPWAALAQSGYTAGMRAFANGRYTEAASHFETALEQRPDFSPYLYHLGMSYQRGDQPDQAVATFQRLVELPDVDKALREKAYVNMMRVLVDLDRQDAVEAAYQQAEAQLSERAPILNQLGRARLNHGAYAKAVSALVRATQLDSGSWTIYNNLGLAYLNQGNLKAARLAFERAAELGPELAFVFNNLGVTYERLQRYEDAARAFRRALAIDPAYAKAKTSLKRVQRLNAREKRPSYTVERDR